MVHQDIYRNGIKLVSVTELQSIISKSHFLDLWRIKLCHCKIHIKENKSKLTDIERKIINDSGIDACGYIYGDKLKDTAGALGTEVHDLVERWLKNPSLEWVKCSNEEALLWANKIVEIYKQNNVKPYIIKPEQNLIDTESNLAGSPDTVAYWNNRPEILDTKIKNNLDELTALQGCGYRYLLNRLYNKDVRYMRPIWCQKKTKNQLVKYDIVYDLDEWMEDWYALVRLWNRLNSNRKVTLHGIQ